MKKSAVLSVLSAVAVCIGGLYLNCGKKGNDNLVGPGNNATTMTFPGTYRATADSIFLTITTPADTYSYCTNDSLVLQIDSGGVQGESGIAYRLSGNTMTITSPSYLVDSGPYLVDENVILTRRGTGSGIEGTWVLTSYSYTVVSGILPDSVRLAIDSEITQMNQMISSGQMSVQLTFSGNQVIETMSYTPDYADSYVSSWTDCSTGYGLDTCTYAVTVTKMNDNTVALHGIKSHETVTIVFDAQGDETYTSSDISHHASTYYANPTVCPDPYEPDWFYTFLSANSKSAAALTKHAAPPVSIRNHALRAMLKNLTHL